MGGKPGSSSRPVRPAAGDDAGSVSRLQHVYLCVRVLPALPPVDANSSITSRTAPAFDLNRRCHDGRMTPGSTGALPKERFVLRFPFLVERPECPVRRWVDIQRQFRLQRGPEG